MLGVFLLYHDGRICLYGEIWESLGPLLLGITRRGYWIALAFLPSAGAGSAYTHTHDGLDIPFGSRGTAEHTPPFMLFSALDAR